MDIYILSSEYAVWAKQSHGSASRLIMMVRECVRDRGATGLHNNVYNTLMFSFWASSSFQSI